MTHLKIGVDGTVEPVKRLTDLIASDGISLYYTIPDEPEIVKHYPVDDSEEKDIRSITVSKKDSNIAVDVLTVTDHRIQFLDPKRHSTGHYELLKEFHNDLIVSKLLRKIAMNGFLVHPKTEIVRVLTKDKRAYILHGGVVLAVGLTLRLSRVFGRVPNDNIAGLEVGDYESDTVKFTYEKILCPKRDLVFEP